MKSLHDFLIYVLILCRLTRLFIIAVAVEPGYILGRLK